MSSVDGSQSTVGKLGKPCHTHEALLVQVHAKLERCKKELGAQQRRDDKGGAQGKKAEKKTEAESDKEEPVEENPLEEEPLDRLEKKRQREILGKQPMQEWYAKPRILPL